MNNPIKLSLLDHAKVHKKMDLARMFCYNTRSTAFISPARRTRSLNCPPKNSRLPLL